MLSQTPSIQTSRAEAAEPQAEEERLKRGQIKVFCMHRFMFRKARFKKILNTFLFDRRFLEIFREQKSQDPEFASILV